MSNSLPNGEDLTREAIKSDDDDSTPSEHPPTVRLGGAHQRIEELLKSLDGVKQLPEFAARLIWEELRFCRSQGDPISANEFCKRYPRWRNELEKLERMSGVGSATGFPRLGEEIEGYLLVAELGRGGQGQVFLTRQLALASRPVVVKITACEGVEHLNLARLQHTNIVPLFGAFDIPERNLRLLCMPFLGGITLAELLSRLRRQTKDRHSGMSVDEILQEVQEEHAKDLPPRGNAQAILGQSSYENYICQVALALAEGLDYAHKNGLVHLDIKPSNILLAPDGRPLLLDFHLARMPLCAGDAQIRGFGGTLRYMSPEQREALAAASLRQPIPEGVDHRSDIYSLGLVLYEALGGVRSVNQEPEPERLPEWNLCISPGLADVVTKCLAAKAEDRYADAAGLADDLRRHLEARPLKGVANRSWQERWQKWRRRRPKALPMYGFVITLLLAIVGTGFFLVSSYFERQSAAATALDDGRELLRKERFKEAQEAFRRGNEQLSGLPGNNALRKALGEDQHLAEHLDRVHGLHGTVNQLRYYTLIDPLPMRAVLVLDADAREKWQARERFKDPADLALPVAIRDRTSADLRDLALLLAEVKVRLASATKVPDAARDAVSLLNDAERTQGSHPALRVARRHYAELAGMKKEDDRSDDAKVSAQTSWDYALIARSHMRAGAFDKAERELRRAIRLPPPHYLPKFYLGYCAYRQGKHAEALAAFSFCLGQEPRPEAYYFRGLSYAAQEEDELALDDYKQAIELESNFGQAYFERGMLHRQHKRWQDAISDFTAALQFGADPVETQLELVQVHIAHKDWKHARSNLDRVLQLRPTHAKALALSKEIPE